jgi:hypothetical protein
MNIRLRFLSASGLETAIINTLEHFLLEPGKGFLREARRRPAPAVMHSESVRAGKSGGARPQSLNSTSFWRHHAAHTPETPAMV